MKKIVALGALWMLAAGLAGFAQNAPKAPETSPKESQHAPAKPRKDLKGVGNFAQVSAELYRGQQPTEEGFKSLQALGIKTVIDLRDAHDDSKLMKDCGLNLLRIPCTASNFTEADVLAFFKTVSDPANQPVFVHCERGADRTGLMVACYRMVEQGWTVDEAAAELPVFKFDKSKTKVMAYIKVFDAAVFKPKIEGAPAPKIEHVE